MSVENGIGERYPLINVAAGVLTLFTRSQAIEDPDYVRVYRENAQNKLAGLLNVEEDILNGFVSEIRERDIKIKDETHPYWNKNLNYSGREIFLTAVQFFDQHNEPLPQSTLPPVEDIKKYIGMVTESENKVGVVQQLRILLDITHNDIVGAANLGMMASRIMARGADRRAYPTLDVSPQDIREWNKKVSQFETYNQEGNDGPGDTYYFWTHFFAAIAYVAIDNKRFKHRILDTMFSKGTGIMTKVRTTISPHFEASLLGREVGLAMVNDMDQ